MITQLHTSDALLLVDVQNDFLESGSLAVPDADAILPLLNKYLALFSDKSLQIIASRDWHPAGHCSFVENGGQWPSHCVADTAGAAFSQFISLPASCHIVSKATTADREAYSDFDGTALTSYLKEQGIKRLFVGGLATDYCVLQTVLDAIDHGFMVVILVDAMRAVDVQSGDGARAIAKMIENGAQTAKFTDIEPS